MVTMMKMRKYFIQASVEMRYNVTAKDDLLVVVAMMPNVATRMVLRLIVLRFSSLMVQTWFPNPRETMYVLIDTAMAFAVRTYLTDTEPTATIDLTVHYLRPHVEGKAICTARVVRPGKRIFTVSAEVHNENGKLIATGLSTYTRLES